MIDPAIRFPGAAARFPNLPAFVEEHLGYRLHVAGDDYVIHIDDPQFRIGLNKPLSLYRPISLANKTAHDLAGTLMRYLPRQMSPYYDQHAIRIDWYFSEDSELSRVYKFLTDLAVAPGSNVRQILRDQVIPFMRDEAGAVCVCPVTVNANLQQAYFSFAKLGLLAERYDPGTAQQFALERRVYRAFLPSALDVLAYVAALTRLAPVALTLPVVRADCAWHFALNGALWAEHIRCTGLFQQFCDPIDPLAKAPSLLGPRELAEFDHEDVLAFLEISVSAINTMMSFLNDFRTFRDPETLVPDFEMQLTSYCATHLLFAELSCMNYSTSGFHRLTRAMGIADKLANLRRHLGTSSLSEATAFQAMFSKKERERLSGIIEHAALRESTKGLVLKMISEAYEGLEKHYIADMGASGADETERLRRVRTQRNLQHGAFLERGRFHEAFGTSAGEAADELVAIAYISILCFALNPAEYLGRDTSEVAG